MDDGEWDPQNEDIDDIGNNEKKNKIMVMFLINKEESKEEEEMECELDAGFTCDKLYQAARQITGNQISRAGVDIRIQHQGDQLPDDPTKTVEQFNIQDGSYIYITVETFGGKCNILY